MKREFFENVEAERNICADVFRVDVTHIVARVITSLLHYGLFEERPKSFQVLVFVGIVELFLKLIEPLEAIQKKSLKGQGLRILLQSFVLLEKAVQIPLRKRKN